MAIYDPDPKEDQRLTAEELHSREVALPDPSQNDGAAEGDSTGKPLSAQDSLRQDLAQDDSEWDAIQDKLNKVGGRSKTPKSDDSDNSSGGGLYRDEGSTRLQRTQARLASASKNRGVQFGAAGGIIAILLTLTSFSSFLNVFRLDHANKNIDQRVYSRLNASIDTRNDYLVRSYVKVRVTEFEGSADHDTLYFKANRVDNDQPFQDFYRTLRKNQFEEKVFNSQGIFFTSMVDKEGNISPAKVKLIQDAGGFDGLSSKYPGLDIKKISAGNTDAVLKMLNTVDAADLEKIATSEGYKSHKAARKDIKAVVNSEIPWQRVLKRRHLRKDIANVVGVKNWRLFEKTRDAIAKKKTSVKNGIYNAMIDKFYSNNPNTAALMKCVFSDGSCSASTDPESPSAQGRPTGESLPDDTSKQTVDENGKQVNKDVKMAGNEVQDDVTKSIDEAVSAEANTAAEKGLTGKAADRFAKASISKKIIYILISKFTGKGIDEVLSNSIPLPDPSKAWTWLKRLAFIDSLLKANDGKLVKMVTNARRSQLMGIFATYSIANDQIKSGQLVGDQLNDFFGTMNNFGNSEGWAVLSGQMTPEQANAQNPQKTAYCKKSPDEVKPDDFAWFCDDKRPDASGRAGDIANAYQNSVGYAIGPIADVVTKVDNTVFGTVLNKVTAVVGDITSNLTQPFVDSFMQSDAGKSLGDVIGSAMGKLLDFLGAGPMFDGSGNDVGNLVVAGGVAEAEASSRSSGGMKSTPATAAFSDKLAANYLQQQTKPNGMADRYIAISNPNSLISKATFAATNVPLSTHLSRLGSYLASLPKLLGTLLSPRAFAQDTGYPDYASWAGVTRYDIPPQCMTYNPLTNNPNEGTNYEKITGDSSLDWDTARDNEKFYKKVYDWVEQDKNTDRSALAETIYNCNIVDARSEGSLGALYGYNKDAGYNPGSTGSDPNQAGTPTTAASANMYWVGDSYTVGMKSAGLETKLQQKGWHVTADGLVSRHLQGEPPAPDGVNQIEKDKAVASQAGIVVVELGTNDIGSSPDQFKAKLQAVYDKIKAVAPNASIAWVNYYVRISPIPDNGKAKSDLLAEFAKGKNIKVLDWNSVGAPYYTSGDGIHPNNYPAIVDYLTGQLGEAPK